jgi:hypothetical protein
MKKKVLEKFFKKFYLMIEINYRNKITIQETCANLTHIDRLVFM